ncbi:fungal protein [Schizosaccharomyces cryophilus OY26]|uniref:Fungal protein n=1 Tax=Schizosaccharomyces cryophilus (strain OY26 / ATCC MYA-4695 / CBS 11777 / NBRC 106824 / NRRL Y48691) TaxID=653667 RepID=S9W2D8_SCHCR|nr:uncharacterized protein SPOG_01879 [Schizosaccharomyces cryophilus OY26]EPY52559.1 fungal protein [Schizosaccharomyces cryophilus OY26]
MSMINKIMRPYNAFKKIPMELKPLVLLIGTAGCTAIFTMGYKLTADPEIRRRPSWTEREQHGADIVSGNRQLAA